MEDSKEKKQINRMLLIAEHDHLVSSGEISSFSAKDFIRYAELKDKEDRIFHFKRALPQTPAEKFKLITQLIQMKMEDGFLEPREEHTLARIIKVLNVSTNSEKKIIRAIGQKLSQKEPAEEVFQRVRHLL